MKATTPSPDTTARDTSGTCEGESCGQGPERIMPRAQNRATVAPVETYRIDGTFVGRKETRSDAATHQLKNGKRVKVVR